MMTASPKLKDLLFDRASGPKIISLLPLDKKKAVLRLMYLIDPELVCGYVNLLWGNSWTVVGPNRIDHCTGYYREGTNVITGWGGANDAEVRAIIFT